VHPGGRTAFTGRPAKSLERLWETIEDIDPQGERLWETIDVIDPQGERLWKTIDVIDP
jgi:hypothetical protein